MKRCARTIWCSGVAVVCVVGWGWWYQRTTVNKKTIAVILSSARSTAAFTRSLRDIIDFFEETNKNPVKIYISEGTAASALSVFRTIYHTGIRKVVGPLSSQEFDESVQQFLAEHPDMVVVLPSITSPKIGEQVKLSNVYRFIPQDDFLVAVYGQVLPLRVPQLKRILFVVRDDAWGQSLVELVTRKFAKWLPHADLQFFTYRVPESFASRELFVTHFAEEINKMRTLLRASNKDTAIVLFSFDELIDYVRLVHADQLFLIPHFGSDMVAYSGVLSADPLVARFLAAVRFEAVAFFADNAYSTKRWSVAQALFERQQKKQVVLVPSQYAFAAFDALHCLSLCQNAGTMRALLDDFYGVTGRIEVDEYGNRRAGTFMGVGLFGAHDQYRWAPFTIIRQEVFFEWHGVSEWIISDVTGGYTISWDPGLDISIRTVGLDLNNISEWTKLDQSFSALNAEYVFMRYRHQGVQHELLFSPAVQTERLRVGTDGFNKKFWIMPTSGQPHLTVVGGVPALNYKNLVS